MRITLSLKRAAGLVAVVSLLTLAFAPTAFASVFAGGEQGDTTCSLPAEVLKNEPGLCTSHRSVAHSSSVGAEPVPSSPTRSSDTSSLWLAVAAVIATAGIAGAAVTIHRHHPHPVA